MRQQIYTTCKFKFKFLYFLIQTVLKMRFNLTQNLHTSKIGVRIVHIQ